MSSSDQPQQPKENHLSVRAKRKNRIPNDVVLSIVETSVLPEELTKAEIVVEQPVVIFEEEQQPTKDSNNNKSNKKKPNNNNNKQEASSSTTDSSED